MKKLGLKPRSAWLNRRPRPAKSSWLQCKLNPPKIEKRDGCHGLAKILNRAEDRIKAEAMEMVTLERIPDFKKNAWDAYNSLIAAGKVKEKHNAND